MSVTLDSVQGFQKNAPYSISFWFKTETVNTSVDRSLFSNGNSVSTTQLFNIKVSSSVSVIDPKIQLFLRDDSNSTKLSNVRSTISFNRQRWNHVVWTDNSGVCNLYINGVLDATNFNYTVGAGAYTLDRTAFGALYRTSLTTALIGMMYDCRVYNRILSADEALSLASGKEVDSTSLALRWIGNQNGGASVFDASGNGNTGTFSIPFYVRDNPFYNIRNFVSGNLVYNGNFNIFPLNDNAPTTTSTVYIDGTATGALVAKGIHACNWAIPASGTAGTNFSAFFDGSTKFSGFASMRLQTTDSSSSIIVSNFINNSPSRNNDPLVRVSPNTAYTLTVMCKTINAVANGAFIDFREYNISGGTTTTILTTSSTKLAGTNDWTQLTINVTTSATTTHLGILMRLIAGQASTAWFDELSVVPTIPETRQNAGTRLQVRDFGTSLYFANNSSYLVNLGTPSVLNLTSNATYSAWVYIAGYPSSDMEIISRAVDADPQNTPYDFSIGASGKMQFTYEYGAGTNVGLAGTTKLSKGFWNFVVATVSTSAGTTTVKLYLNSTLDNTGTNANPPEDSTGSGTYIAGDSGAGHVAYNGGIDSVRIWNRALSQDEITKLYYVGRTRADSLEQGLVGEWLFDEGSGTTALDTSGQGNNGTITGAIYSTNVPMLARQIA